MAAVSLGLSPIQGVYSQSHASGLTNIWFCCGVCSRSLWYGVYSQSHAYGFTINLVLQQRLYRCHAFVYLVSATATVSILNLTPWIYHKVGSATVYILNLMPLATWSIFSRSRSHAYTYLVLLWLRLQCLFSISSKLGSATMSILNLRLLCYQQFGFATVSSLNLVPIRL